MPCRPPSIVRPPALIPSICTGRGEVEQLLTVQLSNEGTRISVAVSQEQSLLGHCGLVGNEEKDAFDGVGSELLLLWLGLCDLEVAV